jgi:hypothetical protein
LLAEIRRLRGAVHSTANVTVTQPDARAPVESETFPSVPVASPTLDALPRAPETGDDVQNPLLRDRPWFFTPTPEMPILIGEATDVAFATRFRQDLMGDSQKHFARTQNVQDEVILSLCSLDCPWPTPSRARFLTKVMLNTACRRYYLVRKSTTLRLVEQAIANPALCDLMSTCKLFAVFALGELYSRRTCQSAEDFPGVNYYVAASRMLRMISEQPRIDCVEIMMMLVSYLSPSTYI